MKIYNKIFDIYLTTPRIKKNYYFKSKIKILHIFIFKENEIVWSYLQRSEVLVKIKKPQLKNECFFP